MIGSWLLLAMFFTPQFLVSAFVSSLFFLACFALDEPEVLLRVIKKLARRKPSARRARRQRRRRASRANSPGHDSRSFGPARSDDDDDDDATAPASTEARSAQRRQLGRERSSQMSDTRQDLNAYSSGSSAFTSEGDGHDKDAYALYEERLSTKYKNTAHVARNDDKEHRRNERDQTRFGVLPANPRSEPCFQRLGPQGQLHLDRGTSGNLRRTACGNTLTRTQTS